MGRSSLAATSQVKFVVRLASVDAIASPILNPLMRSSFTQFVLLQLPLFSFLFVEAKHPQSNHDTPGRQLVGSSRSPCYRPPHTYTPRTSRSGSRPDTTRRQRRCSPRTQGTARCRRRC
ncbi:hypothetical protein B0H67DRAFT_570944 [Lasiosphaeris hirsuta]|uniref:Uncharacterized protein n=1 Tax=Lasiosphaeris hirsuta TaxID=260670 RepID=A0AA40B0R9_9PEZI|nr:hypothetical protein B0H67DRAFT_570944 [Lasiosphaeris hirsuta]